MKGTLEKRQSDWDDFLRRWPIDDLPKMQLSQYSAIGNQDTFIYWLEHTTHDIGSIRGGASAKFGIYSTRKAEADGEYEAGANDTGVRYQDGYAWRNNLGDSPDSAYQKVLDEIVAVAKAAQRGDLSAVESAALWPTVTWKIAFLYQNRSAPRILPIFNPQFLALAVDSAEESMPVLQEHFMRNIGSRNVLEYGEEVLEKIEVKKAEIEVKKAWTVARKLADQYRMKSVGLAEVAEEFKGTHRTTNGVSIDIDPSQLDWCVVADDLRKAEKYAEKNRPECPIARTLYAAALSGATLRDAWENIRGIGAVIPPPKGGDVNYSPMKEHLAYIVHSQGIRLQKPEQSQVALQNPEPTNVNQIATGASMNTIFYGPPGTGKTYITVNAAVEILDPSFFQANQANRPALKHRFDSLVEFGHVKFVTFHQSFSYEDFVEGLRAVTTEDNQLRYEIVDGVFKSLCLAAAARTTQRGEVPSDLAERRIWKMSLGNTLGSEAHVYDDCIKDNMVLLGWGDKANFSGCKNQEDIAKTWREADPTGEIGDFAIRTIATYVLTMNKGDLVVVSDGNLKFRAIGEIVGDYQWIKRDDSYCQSRQVRWLAVYDQSLPYDELMKKQFSQQALYEVKHSVIDLGKLSGLLGGASSDSANGSNAPQAKVLIIDEINRGNVSRIFGELITLIEPSKRKGAEEALEVTLPYSKERFSVPANIHLIGTMNTADRSLSGLDVALRRRFQFREMPPRPEYLSGISIQGIDIASMLRALNERIEILLDRDHCIGHAYFMELTKSKTIETLGMIFRSSILPLLQEYFFEDWQRIQWVLNDHRKNKEHCFIYRPTTDIQNLFGNSVTVNEQSLRWVINDNAFLTPEAYLGIIS